MRALALIAALLALAACDEITPGLTWRCAGGRCAISPANLHHQHAPGERNEFPLPDGSQPED